MANANVRFFTLDGLAAVPADKLGFQAFSFDCPKHAGRRCGNLLIAGATDTKRDGQNENGGVAQWDWDGKTDKPTFSPSVNCRGCWHGFIENGRTVDCSKTDEPTPLA